MFKHILLPTDGSELSQKAVEKAIKLAKALGAKITAINVISQHHVNFVDEGFAVADVSSIQERLKDLEAGLAKRIVDAVKKSADEAGVECDTATPAGNMPYETIIDWANKLGCDVIVIASHGRKGLSGLLLGSETVKVLTHSTIPVLVCR